MVDWKEAIEQLVVVVPAVALGLFTLFRFIVEIRAKAEERKERFLMDAWDRKTTMDAALQTQLDERMLQVLYRHRTGIDGTAEQRAIYDRAISASEGQISYRDIANHLEQMTIRDGMLHVTNVTERVVGACLFTLITLLVLAATVHKPTLMNSTLLACYGAFTFFAWLKVYALSRIAGVLRSIGTSH